jgi:hypothetical protein
MREGESVMERREHERSRSIMSGIFCGVEWFQISGEYFLFWDGSAISFPIKQL